MTGGSRSQSWTPDRASRSFTTSRAANVRSTSSTDRSRMRGTSTSTAMSATGWRFPAGREARERIRSSAVSALMLHDDTRTQTSREPRRLMRESADSRQGPVRVVVAEDSYPIPRVPDRDPEQRAGGGVGRGLPERQRAQEAHRRLATGCDHHINSMGRAIRDVPRGRDLCAGSAGHPRPAGDPSRTPPAKAQAATVRPSGEARRRPAARSLGPRPRPRRQARLPRAPVPRRRLRRASSSPC